MTDRPFDVLHVCMGNICRSPMAERLFVAELASVGGPEAVGLVRSHGAGTGDWHIGHPMDPSAAREVRARGGDPEGFAARQIRPAYVSGADLVLTATGQQAGRVAALDRDARERTFVYGELRRLLEKIDLAALPPYHPTVAAVAARGRALVAAADAARDGAGPLPSDELDDPWGLGADAFSAVADDVVDVVRELARSLVGRA
jgi:protein-tyrosine phosphatase